MNSSKISSFGNWQRFAGRKERENYPIWPNESMLKVLFGNYLKQRLLLPKRMKVLDVGCGFGNNLLPFLVRGDEGFGTEVTAQMARQTQRILKQRGFSAKIVSGTNQQLPFPDNCFDLLLSVGVISYEGDLTGIEKGFAEYLRVLKPAGRLFLTTTALGHEIIQKATRISDHVYTIRGFDFRNGSKFYCFETPKYLRSRLKRYFEDVEVGRVTEQLMTRTFDALIAVGRKP